MDKIELIKAITDYHPGSEIGIESGLSYYTGGMKDSGDWYYRELLDMPEHALQALLDRLIEEFKPRPEPTPDEKSQNIRELEQWFRDRNIKIFPDEINQEEGA